MKATQGKKLIVIGDRVLLKLDETEKRTEVGLYLPETVKDKQEVLAGTIVQTGQGVPMVEPSLLLQGWDSSSEVSVRFMPMQAKAGDYALFLKKAAIPVEYDGDQYQIVPQGAILLLLRDKIENEEEDVVV